MAYLPNNRVYLLPIQVLIDILDGFKYSYAARHYGCNVTDSTVTAMEDIQWWIRSANAGVIDIETYAERTPFSHVVPYEIRYEMLDRLDTYLNNFLHRVMPDLDSVYNEDLHYSIDRGFLVCLDARRNTYVPQDIFDTTTSRNIQKSPDTVYRCRACGSTDVDELLSRDIFY